MQITYDPYADAMYFYFKQSPAAGTTEVAEDIFMDFNSQKKPVGIEILSVSKKFPKKELKSVDLQIYLSKPKPLLS